MSTVRELQKVHAQLRDCRKCPGMCGTPVHGPALDTRVLLFGQAPGIHEASLGRPFAYTAGKTLFQWLHRATGTDEESLRELIYFSAVARCFPGKKGGGDRLPSREEIENCRPNIEAEVRALKPELILAVGKLAIAQTIGEDRPLTEVVGRKFKVSFHGHECIVIPLPHPSGISRWPKMEPGKSLLAKALRLVSLELKRVF